MRATPTASTPPPVWFKWAIASALPLLGGVIIFVLYLTGSIDFKFKQFFTLLVPVVLGTIVVGVIVDRGMRSVRRRRTQAHFAQLRRGMESVLARDLPGAVLAWQAAAQSTGASAVQRTALAKLRLLDKRATEIYRAAQQAEGAEQLGRAHALAQFVVQRFPGLTRTKQVQRYLEKLEAGEPYTRWRASIERLREPLWTQVHAAVKSGDAQRALGLLSDLERLGCADDVAPVRETLAALGYTEALPPEEPIDTGLAFLPTPPPMREGELVTCLESATAEEENLLLSDVVSDALAAFTMAQTANTAAGQS